MISSEPSPILNTSLVGGVVGGVLMIVIIILTMAVILLALRLRKRRNADRGVVAGKFVQSWEFTVYSIATSIQYVN